MEIGLRPRTTEIQYKITGLLAAIGGFPVFLINLPQVDFGLWQQVVVFAVLSFLALLMPTRLPEGADFSVAFIIDLVLITLYGTSMAIVVRFIVTLAANLVASLMGNRSSVLRACILTGQAVLVVGIAGLVQSVVSNQTLAFIASTVVYFLAVSAFFALEGISAPKYAFFTTWFSIMRTLYINFFVLSTLSYLLTYISRNVTLEWKLFSVLLFFVPVMLVSHAFKLALGIKQSYLNTVKTLVRAIEAKDPYTKGHSEHVAELTLALAREMRIDSRELQKLEYIALLHDAGKIGVPEDILNKPYSLSAEEFEEVKKHSALSAEIIRKIKFLSSKSDIVLHHHERYDGTGYPDGLRGEEIPLESRIIAVVDAYDAMTTDRPFRPAQKPQQALEEMARLSGTQFDPKIVELFHTVMRRRGEL